MKKIIDASYLRNSRLKEYLREEKSNFILFTDYACMESFKGRSLTNISKSLEIASEYSEQVIILKNTGDVIKEDLACSIQNELFVDHDQTIGFREFCFEVKAASKGNSYLAKRLFEKSELASIEMENKKKYASLILKGIEEFNKELDQAFVHVLRSKQPWTSSEYDYIWRIVIELCTLLFEKHEQVPNKYTFLKHYIFRYALSSYLLSLKWISEGGWHSYSHEKMRNDLIDMSYVAYATYFDGVLSDDKKINDIYKKSIEFIGKLSKV